MKKVVYRKNRQQIELSEKSYQSVGVRVWLYLMQLGTVIGCHQIPERSFFYKGYQFPVCARCTGILIGYLIGILIWFFLPHSLAIDIALCIPMAVDGITQYLGARTSTQWLRLSTGILGGIGIMLMEIKGLRMIWRWLYEMSKLWK